MIPLRMGYNHLTLPLMNFNWLSDLNRYGFLYFYLYSKLGLPLHNHTIEEFARFLTRPHLKRFLTKLLLALILDHKLQYFELSLLFCDS